MSEPISKGWRCLSDDRQGYPTSNLLPTRAAAMGYAKVHGFQFVAQEMFTDIEEVET